MLYIISTPIGNLKDITLRALEVLKSVDIVLAEDTRVTRKLFEHYGIKVQVISCHDHNEEQRIENVTEWLQEGKSIALVSDAGTPLISDPGYKLVREVKRLGFSVTSVPGACALVAALAISGLPSDQFQFCGFLPAKSGNRKKILDMAKLYSGTTIFYESVHRIIDTLNDVKEVLGSEREITLARELTKQYETVIYDKIGSVITHVESHLDQVRGEYVLLIKGQETVEVESHGIDIEKLLSELVNELPVKQAAKIASNVTGMKKNRLYTMALELQKARQ